ncbi:hypothetical protein ABZ769_23890 [Streptomyces olivoreticuli]
MRDAATGLFAEADAHVPNNGLFGIGLRACNTSDAQTWRVEPVSENTFRLCSDLRIFDNEGCLDIDARPPTPTRTS